MALVEVVRETGKICDNMKVFVAAYGMKETVQAEKGLLPAMEQFGSRAVHAEQKRPDVFSAI